MEVYPRGVQPVKGNHPGLIPISEKNHEKATKKRDMAVDNKALIFNIYKEYSIQFRQVFLFFSGTSSFFSYLL